MFVRTTYFILYAALFLPLIKAVLLSTPSNLFSNVSRHGDLLKKFKIKYVKPKFCFTNYNDNRPNLKNNDVNLTKIYFVTPTYPRPEQVPDLTRLSHTLMHVPRLHWIVADDNFICAKHVRDILKRSGLPYTHISSPNPRLQQLILDFVPFGKPPRGTLNRRAALDWIRTFTKDGILYFGDDDNTYDLRLFDEIRTTKKLSMFPVGLVGLYSVSTPIVSDGKVVGFYDSWKAQRKFPIDMAGFAINLKYLSKNATFPFEAGFQEDHFLTSGGFEVEDIEPLAANCTKVLVWHTQNVKNKRITIHADIEALANSTRQNLAQLIPELDRLQIVTLDKKHDNQSLIILKTDQKYKTSNRSTIITI